MRYISAILAIFCMTDIALAAPPEGADQKLAPWYQSLQQPGTHTSCCSLADCRPVDYRIGQNGYEARWARHWIEIPAEKVLQKTSNPTGQGVLCALDKGEDTDPLIYCFVPASET